MAATNCSFVQMLARMSVIASTGIQYTDLKDTVCSLRTLGISTFGFSETAFSRRALFHQVLPGQDSVILCLFFGDLLNSTTDSCTCLCVSATGPALCKFCSRLESVTRPALHSTGLAHLRAVCIITTDMSASSIAKRNCTAPTLPKATRCIVAYVFPCLHTTSNAAIHY